MGGSPPRYIVDMVTKTAAEIDSVEGIVATRMRTLGARHVVDIEIYVDRDLSVWQGHNIAEQVRSRILSKYDDIIDVMVHVEPSPR